MATPKGFARTIIVITTIAAAIMELIDTSIVNVALNDMSGSLGVSIEDISWVITAYAIANVIIIPLTGFLAEYFGRKELLYRLHDNFYRGILSLRQSIGQPGGNYCLALYTGCGRRCTCCLLRRPFYLMRLR